MNEWKTAGLARIAAKTPVFVREDIVDYLSGNLEYNRVLRKNYVEHVSVQANLQRVGTDRIK